VVVFCFEEPGAAAFAGPGPDCVAFAISLEVGAFDGADFAALSVAGGALIPASVPTSNFKSSGEWELEFKSTSLDADKKPI
jgi:hypothetical protein